jgi:hypothetical protein
MHFGKRHESLSLRQLPPEPERATNDRQIVAGRSVRVARAIERIQIVIVAAQQLACGQ